ncbi:MAG: hypothetical protein AAGA56_30295, partial [Myxococcota bacterium]
EGGVGIAPVVLPWPSMRYVEPLLLISVLPACGDGATRGVAAGEDRDEKERFDVPHARPR